MTTDMSALARHLIRLGEKLGADEVEVYINETTLRNITLIKRVETLSSSHISGLGVRIIEDKRVGLSSTTSLLPQETERVVSRAHSIAKVSKPSEDWDSLTKNMAKAPVEGIYDPDIQTLPAENLSKKGIEMLRAVREQGKGLSVTRGGIMAGIRTTTVVNSHNHVLERTESFASASISVSADVGGSKGTSSESDETHSWQDLDVLGICRRASERAVTAAKACPITSCEIPIVWRNKLFANVLMVMFGGTLSAESVQRKRSPWANRMGLKIAANDLTLIDDGLSKGGMGTREFDDEGVPQRGISLIDKGILKGYYYDTFTANKDHVESTGNATRSYDNPPRPAPNNLALASGNVEFDELIEETKRGLYLQELIGVWLSNPISGYLSATAANAMLIEKGRLTKPVKGVLVSGNFFRILQEGIDLIGTDIDKAGNSYSPTVRVASMAVTPQ